MGNINYRDWQGTIELENVDTNSNYNIYKFLELPEDEIINKICAFVENYKYAKNPTKIKLTISTDRKNHSREITLEEFSNMFVRFEIILEKP